MAGILMSEVVPNMQVLRHAPIREQVASILRDAIMDLRLVPGQLLIERQLCTMTSASRPSIREALRQLEAEGLVESQLGRGTTVAVISPELARQVYQVRAELEGLAAQLFAEQASEDLRNELRRAMGVLEGAAGQEGGLDGGAAILAAKNGVYDVLFRGSGNSVLQQMVQTLQRRVNQLRAMTLSQPGRPARSIIEIKKIMRAIDKRDAAAARAAATQHVVQAAHTIFAMIDRS